MIIVANEFCLLCYQVTCVQNNGMILICEGFFSLIKYLFLILFVHWTEILRNILIFQIKMIFIVGEKYTFYLKKKSQKVVLPDTKIYLDFFYR